jgi:hypothetical protein
MPKADTHCTLQHSAGSTVTAMGMLAKMQTTPFSKKVAKNDTLLLNL